MRKHRKCIIITIIISLIFCILTSVYASSIGSYVPIRLGLKLKHGEGTQESQYFIYLNPSNDVVIFKIDIPDGNFQYGLDKTLYCLKAGPGFGLDNWTKQEAIYNTEEPEYTEQFDLKQALLDTTQIESAYAPYIETIGSDNYKKILYVLDTMYAPEAANAATIRKNLLYQAGLYTPQSGNTPESITNLTDADIDVIQQCVIWYFANSTESAYHSANLQLALGQTVDGTFTNLADVDSKRAQDAQTLYSYFIQSAEANYKNYSVSMDENQNASTRTPIELQDTNVVVEEYAGKYMVGPYRIDSYLDIYYDYQFRLTSEGEDVTAVIKVKDSQGNYVAPTQTTDLLLHDLEGKDFYFEIADVQDLQNLKLEIEGGYYQSNAFYLATNQDKNDLDFEQPVVAIEKYKTPFYFEKTIHYEEFDLALRKFITNVEGTQVTNRIPTFVNTNGEYSYVHTKEPVNVQYGNFVTYTIRVYNEGTQAGYASLIKDDIPEGLTFLPNHATNTTYRWKMLDAAGMETTQVENAVSIVSDYLAKEQEVQTGSNLLQAFENRETPDYKDVQVAFQVSYQVTVPEEESRIIINQAQIAEDTDEQGNPVEDTDSVPDVWNQGEDDQDIEKVKVQYFDLSLRKWVTEAWITEKGKTTVKESGHTAEDDPEAIFKIDLNRKKLNTVTVKFKYSIRITNEGEIAGYATQVKDYVPQGLRFIAEDNPQWTEISSNVIVTEQLKNTLLQPGESTTVDVVLTWINGENNLGVHKNIAEISQDKNDSDTPDIDSTPDNQQPEEDDQDDAETVITVITGQVPMYIGLSITVLAMLIGSMIMIKRYVLS